MYTGESAPSSLGPRYAPDDPTLPKPWKGLIDGSTKLLYYWNPETNITQYEKPVSLPPPSPPHPPPSASTSKPTFVSKGHSVPSNGTLTPHVQQTHHVFQQEEQSNGYLSQQPGHLMSQQHSSVAGQVTVSQHPSIQMVSDGRQYSLQPSQVIQQHGPFAMSSWHLDQQQVMHQGPKMVHGSQQMPQHPNQQTLQNPRRQNMQNQTPLVGPPQGPPYCQQQLQFMGYQQSYHPNMQQNSQKQVQQSPLGQSFGNHFAQKSALLKREEDNIQSGNQVAFSYFQFQQSGGTSSTQNLHPGTNSSQMQQYGVPPDQARKFGGSPGNMQQQHPLVQLQRAGSDLPPRQHHSRFQDQMGPAAMQGQLAGAENLRSRGGNEYYFGKNEGPGIGPHHPRLAAITMARSQQNTGQMPRHPNQQTLQNPGQQNMQNQTPLVGPPQGPPYCQQLQYMGYQQSDHPNMQQNSQKQVQQSPLGQSFGNHFEQKSAFLKREEDNIQSGNQVAFSYFQFQQSGGTTSTQNLHPGTNSSQMQQYGVPPDQARRFGGSLGNMQQQHPLVQLQRAGSDLPPRRHHSRFQDQMGPAAMQGQLAGAENLRSRGGNEYYFGKNEGIGIGPHHPRLAATPMARSQQDTGMSSNIEPVTESNIEPITRVIVEPMTRSNIEQVTGSNIEPVTGSSVEAVNPEKKLYR